MKLFECQNCGQPLYFENTRCESCGLSLGYMPEREVVTALHPEGESWRALAEPTAPYRYCANVANGVCNWLIPADHAEAFCAACRHNRVIPDLSLPDNLAHWRMIEIAKRRLFYSLLKLRLPLTTRAEDPEGLAFDFLSDAGVTPSGHGRVMTGHDNGLITINLAEADDSQRERQRRQMGEPYRTLLGHFRHEIAHYYWGRLVANTPALDEFRRIFGDETRDYGTALRQHYAEGPPANWPQNFVTAYASAHPWEDFAETWAHYFHMVDTLETANSFGLTVRAKLAKTADLAANIDFDAYRADMDRIIEGWLPLTFAVNSINRSMGLSDLYPFVLSPAVIGKLTFVHERINAQRGRTVAPDSDLRAIVSGLTQKVGRAGIS